MGMLLYFKFCLVCGEYTTEVAPQDKTPEEEAVLEILEVFFHYCIDVYTKKIFKNISTLSSALIEY